MSNVIHHKAVPAVPSKPERWHEDGIEVGFDGEVYLMHPGAKWSKDSLRHLHAILGAILGDQPAAITIAPGSTGSGGSSSIADMYCPPVRVNTDAIKPASPPASPATSERPTHVIYCDTIYPVDGWSGDRPTIHGEGWAMSLDRSSWVPYPAPAPLDEATDTTIRCDLIDAIAAIEDKLWEKFGCCAKRGYVIDAVMPIINAALARARDGGR